MNKEDTMNLNPSAQTEKSHKKGQGLVEYALILVLIAVVVIMIVSLLGARVNLVFAQIAVNLDPQYAGMFNGPALTLNAGNVTMPGDGFGGSEVRVTGFIDKTVCASVVTSSGSRLVCGSPPTVSTGITSACVVAVEGRSLTAAVCSP
jgi:pilus assembly protein Flp/PilA